MDSKKMMMIGPEYTIVDIVILLTFKYSPIYLQF